MFERLQQFGIRSVWPLAGLGLLALLPLATGCASSPRETASTIEIPASFSASGTASLPERWWLAFPDPPLAALIDRALAGNLTLQGAWERLLQAEAVARQARAPLLPVVDADAAVAATRGRTAGQTRSGEDYAMGLFADYEVDLWGRLRSGRDAALLDARASAEDLQAAALTLSALVADTWYALAERHGQLELLELQIGMNEKVLELVSLRFRTGQVGIADVLQQRQLVEANRGEQARLKAEAAVLVHQLAVLLAEPPGPWSPPGTATLIDLPPLPQTGVPAETIRRRPDLRRAQFRVQAADREVAAAIADRFPRLSLTARTDSAGKRASDLFNNWLASLAANLVAPVIDGGRRRAEVERTRAVAAEALHAYGQQALEALAEVEDALAREEAQRILIASLERQLALAAQATDRVRDRYLKGTDNYQRVLDALLSHQQLQRTLLTARAELIRVRIDLCRALAGGWEFAGERQKISPG